MNEKYADDLVVSTPATLSYLVTFNYYLAESKIRPYEGIGMGLFSLGTSSATIGIETFVVEYGNKFGIVPKIGLDIGHFTLNISYNIVLGQDKYSA